MKRCQPNVTPDSYLMIPLLNQSHPDSEGLRSGQQTARVGLGNQALERLDRDRLPQNVMNTQLGQAFPEVTGIMT